MELIITIFISYLVGLVITFFILAVIESAGVNWKYFDVHPLWIFAWPLLPIFLLRDLILYINNYLTKNNLKQMNLKILGKAMGFMFLPTLGVLLMLLVGFFDPIMLWTWIKSPSGWAVFTRVVLFLLETGLVILMYFYYLEEDSKNKLKSECKIDLSSEKQVSKYTDIYEVFSDKTSSDSYTYYKNYTENPNITLIERKPIK